MLPCGRCIGCRIDRSKMWAARCVHEAQLHPSNSFITLTYDDRHLPRPGSLQPQHLRDFFKRLRHYAGKFRYYACGEYGDLNFRPHYHALIFGYDPPDKELFRERGKIRVYTSETISKAWQHKGFVTVGELTAESAAYCARYTMKKVGGDQAQYYYSELDPYTGELTPILPEFSRMSLKPGIAAEWFKKYATDVFPDDFVVLKGKRQRVPDYYDELFEREFMGPVQPGKKGTGAIKERRKARAKKAGGNSPERLSAKEKVLAAKLKLLKREV